MILLNLILSMVIAFPKPGARLPSVDKTYLIGAVEPGSKEILINDEVMAVHDLGGFVTMLNVEPGENDVRIEKLLADGTHLMLTNYSFNVATKPKPSTSTSTSTSTQPRIYEKLAYASNVARTNRLGVIYLDAGHGGNDTGTLSPHGIEEKDANLRMTKAVAHELRRLGVEVKLVRSSDTRLELYERARAAHVDPNASAFISIHHNAPACDRDPRLVRYHAVYAWNQLGETLAKPINEAMAAALGSALPNNGVIHANYAVTRSPELPSCLIEVDFITTPEGELDCWNRERRLMIASSIAKGILKWRNALP